MTNNFPKTPLILSSLFCCVFLFAFFYFYRSINNDNKTLRLAENKWQIEARRRDEIKVLDNSIEVIETERSQLERHFAYSADVVPFLNTIEKLASDVGAKATIVSVDILTDPSGLMVGLKSSGTFAELYKFLTLLENSPYELRFSSMSLNKDTTTVESVQWNAVFKLKLLSFMP